MKKERVDSWTEDDDLLLAEIVLRHIREGSTQLQAFDEVGEKTNRTASACGFRWNGVVRKQYETAIRIAKKQRHERKALKIKSPQKKESDFIISQKLEDFLHINEALSEEETQTVMEPKQQDVEKEEMAKENEELKKKNQLLEEELKKANQKILFIQDDYDILLSVINRGKTVMKTEI